MPYAVHTASTTGQSELNTWLEVSWAHIAQSCHFCRVNQEHIVYLKFAPEALADRLNSGKQFTAMQGLSRKVRIQC